MVHIRERDLPDKVQFTIQKYLQKNSVSHAARHCDRDREFKDE